MARRRVENKAAVKETRENTRTRRRKNAKATPRRTWLKRRLKKKIIFTPLLFSVENENNGFVRVRD